MKTYKGKVVDGLCLLAAFLICIFLYIDYDKPTINYSYEISIKKDTVLVTTSFRQNNFFHSCIIETKGFEDFVKIKNYSVVFTRAIHIKNFEEELRSNINQYLE